MQGNILILREKIQILPYDRPTVSYEHLSQLVAEYLLMSCPDVDISAALSIMPATRSAYAATNALFYPSRVGVSIATVTDAGGRARIQRGWT